MATTEPTRGETAITRLAAIVEFSDDAIISKDLNSIITSWNKGAAKIFGYAADDIVGTSILQLIPADLQDEENYILGTIKRGEVVHHLETVRQTKDGRLIDVSVTASPIRNAQGELVGVSKIARDISVQKRHERELLRLNRLYAALSQVNQAIVMTQKRDELFLKVCRALTEFGGFRMAWIGWLDAATGEIIPVGQSGEGLSYLSPITFHVEGSPEEQGPNGIAINRAQTYVVNDFRSDPCTLLRREEAERAGFRAVAAFPIRTQGQICGVISVYAGETDFFQDKEIHLLEEAAGDVSFALDNFKREEERQASETRFRELAENINEVFWMTDPRGERMLYVSPVYEKIWGRPCESLYDAPGAWLEAIESADRGRVTEAWRNAIAADPQPGNLAAEAIREPEFETDYRIVRPDKSIRWIHDRGFAIRNQAGQLLRVVGVARDITETRKLEAQFRQSQKMEGIGQLAGGVAHDFNNILAAIQMQAEILKMDGDITPEQAELAEEIGASVQRAAALTRQLLLFSRREVFQPRELELSESITNMTKMLKRILGEDIEMRLKFDARPMFLHADPGMLDQVLLNLVVNARDAMPEGGRLVIETSGVEFDQLAVSQSTEARTGSFVCLSVSDSGCGIPKELLPKIFEPFFTTKEVGKGTGLGLATVFGIVQQHDGWVGVYSEPDQGTTFRIYFPRSTKSEVLQPKDPAAVTIPRGTETILLAEDDPALRISARKALTQLGYRILEAPTGPKALTVWNENRGEIRLLLTDLVMPGGMTGIELAELMLQGNPKLKIIYMSGYSAEVAAKSFPLTEGVNFLVKPFQVTKLARIIRENLDAPRNDS